MNWRVCWYAFFTGWAARAAIAWITEGDPAMAVLMTLGAIAGAHQWFRYSRPARAS